MNDITKLLVILFAIMFFWVYNVPAFASIMTCSPPSSEGVMECVTQDGTIVIITR